MFGSETGLSSKNEYKLFGDGVPPPTANPDPGTFTPNPNGYYFPG